MVPRAGALEPTTGRAVVLGMKTTIAAKTSLRASARSTHLRNRTIDFRPTLIGMAAAFLSACSASPPSAAEMDGAATANDAENAPSYAELFDTYFDQGKPGHCATAGCHADPSHNVWLCANKDTCYQGMLDVGLIDPADPTHSEIADPKRSPLTWINPAGGNMPLDAQGENATARAAIDAWVAAGARND
jgi:hypothetical protein